MKVIYYVTDHGLGHSSRTIGILRELQKKKVKITIRSNNQVFFKKSMPNIKNVLGNIDLKPIMNSNNKLIFNKNKTRKNVSKWINDFPTILKKEKKIIEKINPDLIISDTSCMPILLGKKLGIKSVVISNFTWNETLSISKNDQSFIKKAYSQADLILKLPFGTPMKFTQQKEVGLLARKITKNKKQIKKKLGISENKYLVILSIGKIGQQISYEDDIHVLDISNYDELRYAYKNEMVEGQNLINAADFVICKCGYGFVSECLSTGTKFQYITDSKHKESFAIHKHLKKLGLENRVSLQDLREIILTSKYFENIESKKIKLDNKNIVKEILKIV